MENKKSITGVICSKFLQSLENKSFAQIFKNCLMVCISLLFVYGLYYPESLISLLYEVISMHNFILIKTVLCFLFVFNCKKSLHLYSLIKKKLKKNVKKSNTIEGIPDIELLDHLFEYNSFKRIDIEKKFCIPRHRFTSLAKKLEDLGVLIRGENNSRILNDKYSRQDLAEIIKGKRKSKELTQLFRKKGENSFTASPRGDEIKNRIKDTLPYPFTVRKLYC